MLVLSTLFQLLVLIVKKYTTFQDFVNFMTAEVEHKNNWHKQLNVAKGRNVSAVHGGRASGRGGRRAYGRGCVHSDNRNQKKLSLHT